MEAFRSAAGTRAIPIGEFFVDYFETVLAPDELVTELRIPLLRHGARAVT